jgi:Imm-5 like putative immunity protein
MAAAIGDAEARALVSTWPELPEHYRSRVELAASPLMEREAVLLAFDYATRALPAWEALFPNDDRPRRAVEACSRWLAGQFSVDLLTEVSKAAADAAIAADEPWYRAPEDPALRAALQAAHAAEPAALAAEYAGKPEEAELRVGDVKELLAWVANFALKTAADPEADKRWQLQRLADYLLCRIAVASSAG